MVREILFKDMEQWGFPYLHDLIPSQISFEKGKFVLVFNEQDFEYSYYAGKKKLTITMDVPLDANGDSSSNVLECKGRRFLWFVRYPWKSRHISLEEFVEFVHKKHRRIQFYSGNWGMGCAMFSCSDFYNATYDIEISTTSVAFEWEE